MKNKRQSYRLTLLTLCAVITINGFAQLLNPPGIIKPVYGEVTPVCDCADLMKVSIPNTTIKSALIDTADGSCRVTAIVNHPPANDSVKVWIAMPVMHWNGRFQGTGGGGFSGGGPLRMKEPISQGFAAGATNTGHDGGSGSFALDSNSYRLNWQLIQDNAYLGIHDMTLVGKALVRAFYGKPARYSYFIGGSTGGRQGLSEAQRFPDDYDGILSLCPATNWHRFVVADLWPQVVMHELNNYVSAAKFAAANKAIIEALDNKDGTMDSVIDDPMHIEFDPKILVGKKVGDDDFTQADADVIRRIWEGPRSRDGKFLWYGLLPGADLSALGGTKSNPHIGNPFSISVDWVRYFLLSDPKWQGVPLTWNEFQLLWNQAVEQYSEVFGTDNPDLTRFRDRGGKLIILHGLTDELIPPQGSINYYQQVQTRMGGAKKTGEFARLFLLPGLDHGFRGPGAKPTNQFESLISWVEQGKIPNSINAEVKDKSNNLVRSRSYASYPETSNMKATAIKKIP